MGRYISQVLGYLHKKIFGYLDDGYIYVFLHLPKTAGTTLKYHFINYIPSENLLFLYFAYPPLKNADSVQSLLKWMSDEQKDKIKIIYGHDAYYGIHKFFKRKVRYVTFFRDPFDIIYSVYNSRLYLYRVNRQKHISPEFYSGGGSFLEFEDFLEGNGTYHNFMFRYLLTRFGKAYPEITDKWVDEEIEKMLRSLYYIGFTDTFDKDIKFISKIFGIPANYFSTNISEANHNTIGSESYVVRDLENVKKNFLLKNARDYKLYNRAKEIVSEYE